MTTTIEATPARTDDKTIYNRIFWLCYLANFLLVMANALTFRFAEFVRFLGGTEQVTGTIVSAGLIATLLARCRLGQEIDRFGTRRLWLGSAVLFTFGSVQLVLAHSLSWSIYLARAMYSVGVAGMFTCVMVFIQNHVPMQRRTEAIGNLGTSGFLGMIAGAHLGDLFLTRLTPSFLQFQLLFGTTAAVGVLCLILVVILTRHDEAQPARGTPPLHRLVVRYWPGSVVLAAMMIGVSLSVTTVFLTRFATQRHLGGIGTFFTGYAFSAFLFRLMARRWSHTVGRHRMILMGLSGHITGHLLLVHVTSAWQLTVPAVACGFGHAMLFPAVVSLGAGKFPRAYWGTGTNLMIGCIELGLALSSPALGWIIDRYDFAPMLYATASTAILIGIAYWLTGARHSDVESSHEETEEFEDFKELEELQELEGKGVASVRDGLSASAAAACKESDDEAIALFPHVGRSA